MSLLERIANAKIVTVQAPGDTLMLSSGIITAAWAIYKGTWTVFIIKKAVAPEHLNPDYPLVPQAT